ncbi:MAG: amidase, partial [Caulobacteraceae bacterium]
GGGSIRIPAACCGLFGLKPSRGRVSFAPADEGWAGFSIHHAITRSVRDSAALLDAACAPQAGDPYWLDPPERPFAEEVGCEPGVLRIAFTTDALASDHLDPECAEAVRAAARLCESLGHRVEEASLPGDRQAVKDAAGAVVAANLAAALETEAARRGALIAEDEVENVTWAFFQSGLGVSGARYIQAVQNAHAFGRTVAAFFESCDVLLLATLGRPPPPIGWLRGDPPDLAHYGERLFAFMPNTQAFNLTGAPAMTVPLAWSESGLPIGVQFVARPADEATLFRLAGQLERAAPWAGRRAGL